MKMSMLRGACALWVSATVVLGTGAVALAEGYPSAPVRVIVPFAPGGSTDTIGRLTASALGEKLKGDFIVENRPGAAANIGHAEAAKSEKDGSTLLLAFSATLSCNHALFKDLNWQVEDFEPISIFTVQPLVAVVNKDFPPNNIAELIAHLKNDPDGVSFGSSGIGSQAHLGGEVFQYVTGTEMTHVPYKGTGDLLPDLLSGQIEMAFALPGAVLSHVKAGTLKVLGVAGTERDFSLPDVPTMKESNVDMVDEGRYGILIPKGAPAEVVEKIATALKEITADPAFVESANKAGFAIRYNDAEQSRSLLQSERERCTNLVQQTGVKLE